jgi:hypothetical protein
MSGLNAKLEGSGFIRVTLGMANVDAASDDRQSMPSFFSL